MSGSYELYMRATMVLLELFGLPVYGYLSVHRRASAKGRSSYVSKEGNEPRGPPSRSFPLVLLIKGSPGDKW